MVISKASFLNFASVHLPLEILCTKLVVQSIILRVHDFLKDRITIIEIMTVMAAAMKIIRLKAMLETFPSIESSIMPTMRTITFKLG